jgi:Tfp pilus assembly PilM family ATPase
MKKYAVVDIETGSIRILLSSVGRTIEITDYIEESIPKEIKSIEDRKIFIKEKLSDLAVFDIPSGNVTVLARGTDIVLRNYSFPSMSASSLQEAVKWKIIEHSHLDESDIVLNYKLNRKKEYRFNARINLTATAASRQAIRKYHEYFGFTRYPRPAVCLEAEGIRGIALACGGEELGRKTAAVMYIGPSLTNVVMLQQNFLTASRIIPTADENFSRVLIGETIVEGKTVTVSREEAEIIKKDIGIPIGQAESSMYAKLLPAAVISQMLHPLLEGFVSEIERFFKFFLTESGVEHIDEILLAGPGTNLKNIATFFENKLKIPTRVIALDAEKHFVLSLKDQKKEPAFRSGIKALASMLGILVCLQNDTLQKIYTPPGIFDKVLSFLGKLYTLLIGVVFLVGYIFLLNRYVQVNNEFNSLEESWRKDLKASYNDFFSLQGERANLSRTITEFNKIKKANKVPWLEIFREISLMTPRGVALKTLKVREAAASGGERENVLEMKGSVQGPETGVEETITRFTLDLNNSRLFRNVHIVSMEKDAARSDAMNFEISARVRGE